MSSNGWMAWATTTMTKKKTRTNTKPVLPSFFASRKKGQWKRSEAACSSFFSFRSAVLPWTCGHKYISHFLFAKLKIANLWIIDLNSVCRIFLFFATICLLSWIHEQYSLSLSLAAWWTRTSSICAPNAFTEQAGKSIETYIETNVASKWTQKNRNFADLRRFLFDSCWPQSAFIFVSNDDSEITSMAWPAGTSFTVLRMQAKINHRRSSQPAILPSNGGRWWNSEPATHARA